MATEIDVLKTVLKRHGKSVTIARQTVFGVLTTHEAQTMAELINSVGTAANRASVYRVIALFEQLDIVRRLQMGWKYKLELSDAFVHHHHHFSCTNCGRTISLPQNKALETAIETLAWQQNLQPKQHQVEISGLCNNCQTK